ncbi:hypothetical protein LVJ94_52620 [Pendulispora rubella]|uniref:Uncharacterized protein n=1 Tax=Pendulispora rubella TaxID=2741070 RepID=A0ABZ2L3J7_9BACT
MTRLARVAALLFATSAAAAGCSPEREILSTLDEKEKPQEPLPQKPDGEAPPSPAACKTHETCALGTLCTQAPDEKFATCKPCAKMDPSEGCKTCPPNASKVSDNVNGCTVCSCGLPSSCFEDAQCNKGERCYMGQTCDPGCTSSPKCCHGNLCAATGCTDTTGLDCTLVGCPTGLVCDSNCSPPKCFCDATSKQWKCDGGCKATCVYPK